MALTWHSGRRGFLGFLTYLTGSDGQSRGGVIPAFVAVSATGVEYNASNPQPVTQASVALPAGTDRSGSITAGGTAQDVAVANASRVGMTFQNTSDTAMHLTESGVDASLTVGYLVNSGIAINISTNKRISVHCATTGKTFASTEY